MEISNELLKEELGCSTLTPTELTGSGTLSSGRAYLTDQGPIYVKFNTHPLALELFQGEYEGLLAVEATNTMTTPKPIKVIRNPTGGAVLVLEYMDMQPISDFAALGEQVARLHLHNSDLKRKVEIQSLNITKPKNSGYVDKFGFHISNHCGYFPQPNEWMDNWIDFYARKMENHVRLAEEKHNDRDARPLWSSIVPKLHKLFEGIEVVPALLHGDLWRGNIKQSSIGPVAYDPIAFYGHSEFELSIAYVHGGFDDAYFSSYHRLVPRQPGFEDRLDLYLLHHYFVIWNHCGDKFHDGVMQETGRSLHMARFGKGYKQSTLDLLQRLEKKLS